LSFFKLYARDLLSKFLLKEDFMAKVLFSFLLVFSGTLIAAFPIRPMVITRPVVLKPEFARIRFQNNITRFNSSKEIAIYFNNDQIGEGFDPSQLSPSQRQFLDQLLNDVKAHKESFNQDILKNLIQSFSGSAMDIDSLIQWVMAEMAKDSSADLRAMMDEMQKNNKKKRDLRNSLKSLGERINLCSSTNCGTLSQLNAQKDILKNQLDSMSEMGEQQSLRLQMAMDRVSKFMETLSNIMKKFSETSSQIISNLK
jgi:hypothetical protein